MWPQQQQQGGLLNPLRNNSALMMSMASGLLGAPSLGEGLSKGFGRATQGMQMDQSRQMQQYKMAQYQNEREREQSEQERRNQALQGWTQQQIAEGKMSPQQAQLYMADPKLGTTLSPLEGVGGSSYGTTPIPVRNPDGSLSYYQANSGAGAPRRMDFGEGTPMAPGEKAYETRAGTERAKAEAGKPQAQARAHAAIGKSAQAADMARSLSQHQDVAMATGSIQGRLPTYFSQGARNFETELDTLKTKVFVNAIAEMRELSKTGGALGQVTEREIHKMENSMRNLDLTQDEASMRRNLKLLAGDFDEAQRNIAAAYEQQFGEPFQGFGGGQEAPAMQGGGEATQGGGVIDFNSLPE